MLLLGLFVITAPTDSAAQGRPRSPGLVNGSYEVVFAGFLTGSGRANVSQQGVMIIAAQIGNEKGANGNFNVKCTRNGNHFTGTGSAPGGTVTIKGRLDPSNRALQAARISFTYMISNGKSGRAAGNGPPRGPGGGNGK
jgi:hypothetical protein